MFKPKLIEPIPYIVIEYFISKPNSFIKINGEYFELTNEASEIDKKIYNYYFNEKSEKNINDIEEEIKKFENNLNNK